MPRRPRNPDEDVEADATDVAAIFCGPYREHWAQALVAAGGLLLDPAWRPPPDSVMTHMSLSPSPGERLHGAPRVKTLPRSGATKPSWMLRPPSRNGTPPAHRVLAEG